MPRGSAGSGSVFDREVSSTATGGELRAAACTILHVDMDAFFASVEVLDDPALAGKPVIVGGSGTRGVVASCTYEARAFGIRSAMSSLEARRRCPDAVFLSGRYGRYAEISEQLHSVLLGFTPLVEGIALDEAFLDVGGARRLLGSPLEIAHQVRRAVQDGLSLVCSVGVARTKLVAKLASRAAKPTVGADGVTEGLGVVLVAPEDELSFLSPLPVMALWGVGPVTARRLADVGVVSVGDVVKFPSQTLERLLGAANGRHIAGLARGEDPSAVQPNRAPKSVGHEETFAVDVGAHAALHRDVIRMSDAVAERLRESSLSGRTVVLKIRYADRSTVTRSQTLPTPTNSARAIGVVAGALLDSLDVSGGVRLLGIALSSLVKDPGKVRQLTFDMGRSGGEPREVGGEGPAPEHLEGSIRSEPSPGIEQAWDEVESAVFQIRARYGQSAVGSARLLGSAGLSVKRKGDTQWGPSGRTE